MPQTRTQTCTDQHNKHRFIAFIESSKRMPKAAVAADDRVDRGQLLAQAPSTAVRSSQIMARARPPTCCGVASVAPASALMYSRTVHHQQRSSCS